MVGSLTMRRLRGKWLNVIKRINKFTFLLLCAHIIHLSTAKEKAEWQ